MDHVTRATAFSEMFGRPKAKTQYSLQAHKIRRRIAFAFAFSRSRDISGGVEF